ncbi:KIF25 isoform X2 [Octopus vulgaris]|uniref:KIF25 isoform X2 n=1 Tax=Octopus vulgaris TaxID=6645 RepID=A0AA36AS93_OCTVU|nr:KIF25 isoform X2 [Octopus vulgaris]
MHTVIIDKVHTSHTPIKDEPKPSQTFLNKAYGVIQWRRLSGVKGAAFRETSSINKSLSALADVLGALAERRTHVPYRNSRLTYFLQDSIDIKLSIT